MLDEFLGQLGVVMEVHNFSTGGLRPIYLRAEIGFEWRMDELRKGLVLYIRCLPERNMGRFSQMD